MYYNAAYEAIAPDGESAPADRTPQMGPEHNVLSLQLLSPICHRYH